MKEYNDVVELCQMHGVQVSKALLGRGKFLYMYHLPSPSQGPNIVTSAFSFSTGGETLDKAANISFHLNNSFRLPENKHVYQ